MCLLLFGYKISQKYPLILAANRDEFHKRPTAPMHFWEDRPGILAGKDLEQGGTWFGINKTGRFAALTNYRDPSSVKQTAPSRGEIIIDFLESDKPCDMYFNAFKNHASYNGFNLVFGDLKNFFWFSNLENRIKKIPPGIHGISNRLLDTSWPKVESGKAALKKAVSQAITTESLFSILTNQTIPDDNQLPDTGVGLEWERLLSPLFIQSETYGTRSSIVMLMDRNGNIKITERTYDPKNKFKYSDKDFSINNFINS